MNLALFDFDGTITRGDTFIPFLRYSARPSRLVACGIVLSPLLAAYRAGLLPGRVGRPPAARVAFVGERADRIRGRGRSYAAEVIPHLVRRRALERIDWHQQQGDRVVVVSGSLDVYLGPWCASAGLEAVCTELEEHRGRLTGRYVGGDCVCAEKARRIRARYDLAAYPVIYAYGDSEDDREMLELAHERYFRWQKLRVGAVVSA